MPCSCPFFVQYYTKSTVLDSWLAYYVGCSQIKLKNLQAALEKQKEIEDREKAAEMLNAVGNNTDIPDDTPTDENPAESDDENVQGIDDESEKDNTRDARQSTALKSDISLILCPEGCTAFMAFRPREPKWFGPPDERPFAATKFPCLVPNFNDLPALLDRLKMQEKFNISIEIPKDRGCYKDQMRGISTLFQSGDSHTQDLQCHLLQPSRNGKQYNFRRRVENSTINAHADSTEVQTKLYHELDSVLERLYPIKAVYGSGKSRFMIRVFLEFLMAKPLPNDKDENTTRSNKVLVLCPHNQDVNNLITEYSEVPNEFEVDVKASGRAGKVYGAVGAKV